jgi:hypothetical protein
LAADIEGGTKAKGVWDRVLRVIIRAERDKVTGVWKALINEELNNLKSSPIVIRVVKKRSMRWAGHVSHMEEKGGTYRERELLENLGINGRILLMVKCGA